MELKIYLNILLKKWWIVIPAFLITLTSGIALTYTMTPTYSATTSYIVVPSSAFGDERSFASGLDLLGRRDEIAATFAEIASSRSVKQVAFASILAQSSNDYSISSRLRSGTNIIEVTATGPDPVVVRDLANAVGTSMEEYVQGLYEVFTLVLLDEATTPWRLASPNTRLNIILAAILGLVLGGGLAFLSAYLETPIEADVSVMHILDEETGVYNKEYYLHRLGREMIRAKRNQYPLSIALLRIENLSLLKGRGSATVRAKFLQQVGMLLSQHLREEDIVAYFKDETFAILLPDMTGENTKALMEYLQTRVAWAPLESANGVKFNLKGLVGAASYGHNGVSRDELVAQASQALQLAEA